MSKFFASLSENHGSLEPSEIENNYEQSKDHDPFKTDMKKFESKDSNGDIFSYVDMFSLIAAPRYPTDEKKCEALLNRLCLNDRMKITNHDTDNYDNLCLSLCEQLGADISQTDFDDFFAKSSLSLGNCIADHFTRLTAKWRGFTKFCIVNSLAEPQNDTFFDKFEKTLPAFIMQEISSARIKQEFTTISGLGNYIDKYRQSWKRVAAKMLANENQPSVMKMVEKKIAQLENENKVRASSITNIQEELTATQTNLTVIAQGNSTYSKALENLSKQTALAQSALTLLQTQNEEIQQNLRHTENNVYNMQTQRFAPTIHPDRESRFSNFISKRPRSDSGTGSDRSTTSRSPSPNPPDNTCFACTGNHWQIECPDLTRMEKELELFKLISKFREREKSSHKPPNPNLENELRTKYNLPFTVTNQYYNNNHKVPPTGTGPYCKWCHVKGHLALVCPKFCPICETKGHSWKDCTKDPALVTRRKASMSFLITKSSQKSKP